MATDYRAYYWLIVCGLIALFTVTTAEWANAHRKPGWARAHCLASAQDDLDCACGLLGAREVWWRARIVDGGPCCYDADRPR